MAGENLSLFADEDAPLAEQAYVLNRLEVCNWGPFAGLHRAEIDLAGTALIGQTGSGKTTLVDAFMTLICPQPRYNLASTGGHESDRDLLSYVRGVSGAGRGDSEHIARPAATRSAILARFASGARQLSIAALFAMDSTSMAPGDLDRLWLLTERQELALDELLELWHGSGKRNLKAWAREQGVEVFDSKKPYLARLRRFFAVGENAFTLLNRAAGLKQLNSIDELFRELVLDDSSAFIRAAEVAGEFADLRAIHEELEIARRQQQSLLPLRALWDERLRLVEAGQQQQELIRLAPLWYAGHALRLWTAQEQALQCQQVEQQQVLQQLDAALRLQEDEVQTLRDRYQQVGGSAIEPLREQISAREQEHRHCERRAGDYQQRVRALGLADALDAQVFAANLQRLPQLRAAQQLRREQLDEQLLVGKVQERQLGERLSGVEESLRQVLARPGSNIPPQYQQFRAALAGQLGCSEDSLPFVAELVEVQGEHAAWRGAIERAIGGQRLRLLVPPARLRAALDWVNGRDNQLHVRLLDAAEPQKISAPLADGFVVRLNWREHAAAPAARQLLAELDRHCVDSVQALQHTAHGMTVQGLMSGRSGFYEKQDRSPLGQGWMTGFDNRDQLAALERELAELRGELDQLLQTLRPLQRELAGLDAGLALLQQLETTDFADIDLPGSQARLASLQRRLAELTDPDSDIGRARQHWEQADAALRKAHRERADAEARLASLQRDAERAARGRQQAAADGGGTLDARQQALLDARLTLPAEVEPLELPRLEKQALERLHGEAQSLASRLAERERKLTVQMGTALREDRGALSEAGTQVQDVPLYLQRLDLLTREALPEKQKRFQDYLTHSSDQSVTQLLRGIEAEVDRIREKIDDINHTMRAVDFQSGCYLQLEPRPVVHESLRTLQQARSELRVAELQDDAGESHFRALSRVVELLRDASERRSTLGARALLDPRHRLQFSVSVIERSTGQVLETRTGSQGGSGGEKEIIASYILTASLSYALCPDGRRRPLFGTIVLDEAFSKSSQAVAGRIISALREFGLHPLFVTPNKEMRLLRAHTRSAILIHRRGSEASMTSLSWEALDELHQQHRARRDEVAG